MHHTHYSIGESFYCDYCEDVLMPKRVEYIGKHGIYYARGRND